MRSWLRLEKLQFGYDGIALTGPLSLRLPTNEPFFAIAGRSGIGKSTLLHTIAGLHKPLEGTVRVFGSAPGTATGDLPVVFQSYGLFPWKSAIGNVEFSLKCRHISRTDRRTHALALLKTMGVEHAADKAVQSLSGGMAQRVAIARALAASPKCLLLDEPFSALDAVTKRSVVAQLKAVARDFGICVLLVTHDLEDAITLAQNIMILREGKVPELFHHSHWGNQSPRQISRALERDIQSI